MFIFLLALIYLFTPLLVETSINTLDQIKEGYTPVRYGLPLFYFLALAVFTNLEKVNKHIKTIRLYVFVSILISVSINISKIYYNYFGLLFLVLFIIAYLLALFKKDYSSFSIIINLKNYLIFIVLSILIFLGSFLIKSKIRAQFYDIIINKSIIYGKDKTNVIEWLDANVTNNNLLVYGLPPYPFSGNNYQNKLFFNNLRNKIDTSYNFIDYIVFAKDVFNQNSQTIGCFPKEEEIIKGNKVFKVVYNDSIVKVYSNTSEK
jgi:hypothetical protein